MRDLEKRLNTSKDLHCAHCALRFGIAEHYVIREGKTFHNSCYVKTQIQKEEIAYETSTKESDTSIGRD